MGRTFATLCSALAMTLAMPQGALAKADPALAELARDVDRVESVRAVTNLQRNYAQYAQFGLWSQVGDLFAIDGRFVFDGQVTSGETVSGGKAIASFLRTRYGGGAEGLRAGSVSSMFIENPVVNLAPDGESAKARWNAIIFHGHGGNARVEGGVFENEYVRQGGVWRISTAHYYPQYDGPYDKGFTNWGGGDLPIVPHHFDSVSAGIPIAPAIGSAPASNATAAQLLSRVNALNDEDRVRNLQAAYGFYQDRKMWNDVVDLFTSDGVVEVGGHGLWKGKAGVRRWLETMGPAGLKHGELNDQVQFDTTVTIAPGGNEAWARGLELGMLGDADREKGWWQVTAFRNRFVKENGVWKLRELRRFPLMKADVFKGWGSALVDDPVPGGSNAPDASNPAADAARDGLAMPAFAPNPVTGAAIAPSGTARIVAAEPLTAAIPPGKVKSAPVKELRRRLARSAAWDGTMNVAAAYGYYLDDSMPQGFGGVLATKGFKMTPFAGYYIGRERVMSARTSGPQITTRRGIPYHWLVQPVVLVSNDGRSTLARQRLFQPRTGKQVLDTNEMLTASFWGGMYHNRFVLENGVWRVWELTLDEPYIVPVKWTDGIWAKAKDPAGGVPKRSFSGGNFPPDVPLLSLGKREEGFWGGTGTTVQWPTQLPMWFSYVNPVSGREPEFYHPQCVPCTIRPDLALSRNGYQEPQGFVAANKVP